MGFYNKYFTNINKDKVILLWLINPYQDQGKQNGKAKT